MNMDKLRGNGFLKAMAFLFACLFAAGICAAAGGGYYLYGQRRYYQNNAWEQDLYYTQAEEAKEYFFLSQHRNALTPAGLSRYDELTRSLSDKYTNFRYEFGLTSDASILLTNVPDGGEGYDTLDTVDSTEYENAMGRMLAWYLDMNKAGDWQVRTGSAQEWAAAPMASRYYYTREDYENILQDAKQSNASEAETYGGYTEVDEAAVLIEGEANVPPETASEEAQKEQPSYVYFVYTGDNDAFWLTCGVDRSYPVEDTYSLNADRGLTMEHYFQEHYPLVLWIGVGALVLFLLLLTWLTWAIGWNGAGELALRGANRMPIELALILGGVPALIGLALEANFFYTLRNYTYVDLTYNMLTTGVFALPIAFGAMVLWTVGTAQIKTRTLTKQSILAQLWRWNIRWLRLARRTAGRTLLSLPLYWKAAVGCGLYWLAYLIYYFVIDALFGYHHLLLTVFWLTLPLLPPAALACKWALDWTRLRRGVKEMVAGKLDFQVDTARMLPDLRVHGADLNSLSEGLSLALEERMRGERFKTELITNVSHDLKTPLTSIVNYVDLLKQADIQDEKARGYIEVLERKTQRLKTLTEDLVEASKAASGTIAVHLERLDVGQLVAQAAAEYDERLRNADLRTVMQLPESPCMVMADGRHLWRILDNLLGNCTKYAMPGTRVYLDVERREDRCLVTVKNISADPLNVPAEELMKRFVRGDSARSTEGSGLGLSIARNLANAQGAGFDLVVDGDLFKAIISIPTAD